MRMLVAQITGMNPDQISGKEPYTESKPFWDHVIEREKFGRGLSSLICGLFELQPRLHVTEVIERVLLPILPNFVPYTTRQDLDQVKRAFASGAVRALDVSGAAWLLLLDSALWISNAFERPEGSRFNELADLTRFSQEARLRFAHCIRDLAYGNEQRVSDLIAMVKKPDAEMHRLLVDICWIDERKSSTKLTVNSPTIFRERFAKSRFSRLTGLVT